VLSRPFAQSIFSDAANERGGADKGPIERGSRLFWDVPWAVYGQPRARSRCTSQPRSMREQKPSKLEPALDQNRKELSRNAAAPREQQSKREKRSSANGPEGTRDGSQCECQSRGASKARVAKCPGISATSSKPRARNTNATAVRTRATPN